MRNLRAILVLNAVIFGLFIAGAANAAKPDKQPNPKSVAAVAACLQDPATAFVCSSKELSNVVLQCRSGDGVVYFDKHDDLDVDPAYQGEFVCRSSVDGELVPNGDTVEVVAIKSGSFKDPNRPEGAPRGSGAFFNPQECPVECPEPGGEIPGDDIPQ